MAGIDDREEVQRKAAIELARQKVLAAYSNVPENYVEVEEKKATKQQEERTPRHEDSAHVDPEMWKKYHSAWQQYYQKYYEQYYQSAAEKPAKESRNKKHGAKKDAEKLEELRETIRENASEAADREEARKNRHVVPLVMGILVVLTFAFLQYNRSILAVVRAYVTPGNADGVSIVELDPTITTSVGPEPKLIIPKINVEVPIVFGAKNDQKSQLDAMVKGVSHFTVKGADSVPGQVGNTVLSGHSSNDLFDSGDYKFIFAQLERMDKGDTVYVNYKGTRYTYAVTKKEVVRPADVQKLIYPTDKPVLTLITCVPLGTANNRLLVTAEQISPNPDNAPTEKPTGDEEQTQQEEPLPRNSPTLLERFVDWLVGLFS